MLVTSIRKVAWFTFLIATVVQAAYDLTKRLTPLGPLGVRLDYDLARTSGTGSVTPANSADIRTVVVTSYITFREDVTRITDGQLFQMAKNAYQEMLLDLQQYGFRRAKPRVMTALAIGNTIYFASSMLGKPTFTMDLKETPVYKSLQECQIMSREPPREPPIEDPNHQNQGSCGEIMVAHIWFRQNPGVSKMTGRNAKIVTVETQKGVITIKKPCGTDEADSWGCNLFVLNQGIAVVPKDTTTPEPYQLDTLAGGWMAIGQLTLCS